MHLNTNELYEFGPYQLDAAKRILLRENRPVPLQLKAFQILLVLVRNCEQVVLKDELIKEVWPDSWVEESNLAQNIYVLRRALNPNDDGPRYIVTIPGRGYCFTEKVRIVGKITEAPKSPPDQEAPDPPATTNGHLPDHQTHAIPQGPARKGRLTLPIVALSLLALVAVAFFFRPTVPPPQVTRIRQLTKTGTLVHNTRLVTDGPRIYFRAWQNNQRVLRAVSTQGGDAVDIQNPIPVFDIDDIAPDGSAFLEVNLSDANQSPDSREIYETIWRVPVPSGSPQPMGALRTSEAAWSPDGRIVAYAYESALYCANADGSGSRKIATLPEDPYYLSWSPNSKLLRFTAANAAHTGDDLWEANLRTNAVRPLIADTLGASRPWSGGWTPDGRYFLYTAVTDGIRNVWAIREKDELFRRVNRHPVQLTNGPFGFNLLVPGKDGKRAFAAGGELRGQLVRYDSKMQQFTQYSEGHSVDHVSFSADGKWMVYIEFPEGNLVRSRVDGTDRLQLTSPPMRALSPQWSFDGAKIAFTASSQNGEFSKIYLVSRDGGQLGPATSQSYDRESSPSWAPDGNSILYSSADASGTSHELRMLDVKTGATTSVSGTAGLGLSQISRDGKKIAAIIKASNQLAVYDIGTQKLQNLQMMADYPHWSADSKYLYFNSPYFSAGTEAGGIYRWNMSSNSIEPILKYPNFMLTGVFGVDYGITPDGSILLVRDVTTRDLYAIDLNLP